MDEDDEGPAELPAQQPEVQQSGVVQTATKKRRVMLQSVKQSLVKTRTSAFCSADRVLSNRFDI